MSATVACSCGYRGATIKHEGQDACPICRTPVGEAEKTYRIPCPNGHMLRAKEGWMGREMVCPQCNEPFVLRMDDSVEFREFRRKRQDERDAKKAQAWLNRAITAAVIIVLSFVVMIILSVYR